MVGVDSASLLSFAFLTVARNFILSSASILTIGCSALVFGMIGVLGVDCGSDGVVGFVVVVGAVGSVI